MKTFSLFFFIILSAIIPNALFAKDCNSSGKKTLFKKEYAVTLKSQGVQNKVNKQVISTISNYKENLCPKACIQKNDFQIHVDSHPKYTKKNSCKGTDEKYTFKKQFKTRSRNNKIEDMKHSSKLLANWISKTFINPYVPFKKQHVSMEHKNLLHSACPPCSFYLSYNYRFTKNNVVDSNILVKCGDRKIIRIFGANFTTKVKITNQWKCHNKKM